MSRAVHNTSVIRMIGIAPHIVIVAADKTPHTCWEGAVTDAGSGAAVALWPRLRGRAAPPTAGTEAARHRSTSVGGTEAWQRSPFHLPHAPTSGICRRRRRLNHSAAVCGPAGEAQQPER